MTREQAKQALSATFCFKRVGDQIALREIGLIEKILAHKMKRVDTSSPTVHSELHSSQPS